MVAVAGVWGARWGMGIRGGGGMGCNNFVFELELKIKFPMQSAWEYSHAACMGIITNFAIEL